MNAYDSNVICDLLIKRGLCSVDAPQRADLVILNTCHIRSKAAEKVYSELGRLARLSNKPRLAVAGCVAQGEGEEIMRRAPYVDLLIGPQALHQLDDLLDKMEGGMARKECVSLEFRFEAVLIICPKNLSARCSLSYDSEGCDRLCTFCVVAYTRGAELPRPPEKFA